MTSPDSQVLPSYLRDGIKPEMNITREKRIFSGDQIRSPKRASSERLRRLICAETFGCDRANDHLDSNGTEAVIKRLTKAR